MINKQQVIYYFTLFVILLKHIILPGILAFMTSKLVSQKINDVSNIKNDSNIKASIYFSWYFWISYFTVYYLIKYGYIFYALSYYVIFILILALMIVRYIQPIFIDNPNKKSLTFLLWFMFLSTSITILGTIYTLHYRGVIKKKDGLMGDRGEQGPSGNSGEKSKDIGIDNIAYTYLIKEANNIYREYKSGKLLNVNRFNNKEKTEVYDKDIDYITNMYFQDNIKRICYSQKFKNRIEANGIKESVESLYPVITEWVNHILSFKNGDKWLEDHFSTDYHWKTSGQYGSQITKDERLNTILLRATSQYPNDLLDKLKITYGKNIYDNVKKTIIIFITNTFTKELKNNPDGVEDKLQEVIDNKDDNILKEVKNASNLKELMNFYNHHKEERLLKDNDNEINDPFILIFNHEVWNWGQPHEYSECEIQELKEQEKENNLIRKKDIFETRYKNQNNLMDSLIDLSELSNLSETSDKSLN